MRQLAERQQREVGKRQTSEEQLQQLGTRSIIIRAGGGNEPSSNGHVGSDNKKLKFIQI